MDLRHWLSQAVDVGNNYPFSHSRYAGQMVKPPHPAVIVGYLTAMQANLNNHAEEGGPAATEMEHSLPSVNSWSSTCLS